ncbi:MAG: hypothetical protein WBB67_15375 [bacterium]
MVKNGVDLGVLLQYKNSKMTDIYISEKDIRWIKNPFRVLLKGD